MSLALPELARQVGCCGGVAWGRSSLLDPQTSDKVTGTLTFLKSLDLPQTPCEGIFHAPRLVKKLVARLGVNSYIN